MRGEGEPLFVFVFSYDNKSLSLLLDNWIEFIVLLFCPANKRWRVDESIDY